jgi:hypothetical protein
MGLAYDNGFLEARYGGRDQDVELGDLGACESSWMLLLFDTEGAFERPKELMGGRQLARRGQLRVGEDHHHFHDPLRCAQEQLPSFAVERTALRFDQRDHVT